MGIRLDCEAIEWSTGDTWEFVSRIAHTTEGTSTRVEDEEGGAMMGEGQGALSGESDDDNNQTIMKEFGAQEEFEGYTTKYIEDQDRIMASEVLASDNFEALDDLYSRS